MTNLNCIQGLRHPRPDSRRDQRGPRLRRRPRVRRASCSRSASPWVTTSGCRSPQLAAAVKRGLTDSGVDVLDIGLCGTEGVYFATFAERLDGGIMVTASHNPPDYNGMKFVREQARPISADTGLNEIRARIESGRLPPRAAQPGIERTLDIRAKYLEHLLGYVEPRPPEAPQGRRQSPATAAPGSSSTSSSRTCRSSSSRSTTSPTALSPTACRTRCWRRTAPRPPMRSAAARADVGLAWDGDFDRCFFFDETRPASSRAITWSGCWRRCSCAAEPGARIVHDPRLTWNTLDIVQSPRRHSRCCASPATPSSSRRCARSMPSTAAR